MAVEVCCAECAAPLNRADMQFDSEYRLVCQRCCRDDASEEEIAASVARRIVDSAIHWRALSGITPALEEARPGHNLWSALFWLVVALCAAAYVWAFCR